MAADVREPAISSVGRFADVSTVKKFLLRIVPTLLEEEDIVDYSNFEKALNEEEGKIKRFVEESQEHTLTVLRFLPLESAGEEDSSDVSSVSPQYEIQLGVHYKTQRCVGVVFIKRSTSIEAEKSVRSQLRVINVSEDSPFETLHAYVQDAVNPLFSSFIQESRGDER